MFDSLISSLFINSVLALHGPKSKVSEEQKEIRTIWRAKAHLECGRECSRLVKTNWARDKEPSLIKPWVRNGHLKCKDPKKERKKHRKFPFQKETARPMYKCLKTISWQKTPYILCKKSGHWRPSRLKTQTVCVVTSRALLINNPWDRKGLKTGKTLS